jgi:hypothetical protein
MLTTPSGRPHFSRISASTEVSSGVSGAGFNTMVEPEARAGASLRVVMNSGTFHGMIPAATPTGSRRTRVGPSMPSRISSNAYSRVRFA